MTGVLQQFIETLPIEIRKQVQGKKDKKALSILKEHGIDVPKDVLSVIDNKISETRQHENVMNSMQRFLKSD